MNVQKEDQCVSTIVLTLGAVMFVHVHLDIVLTLMDTLAKVNS